MDPLSVAASVIGVLSAAAKISSLLVTFVHNANAAPESAKSALREVRETDVCLRQLQCFLVGSMAVSNSRTSQVTVEQVLVILTECVSIFSTLEELVDGSRLSTSFGIIDRLKWVHGEKKITPIISRLRSSKVSLNLILTILTCSSMDSMRISIESLNNQMIQNHQETIQRFKDLESRSFRPLHPIISKEASSILSTVENDTNSVLTTRSQIDQHAKLQTVDHSIAFGFAFEEDLKRSRVYQRRGFTLTECSLPSGPHTMSWSIFSGLSLAQISNLSILNLPICLQELSNSQHYSGNVGQIYIIGPDKVLPLEHGRSRIRIRLIGLDQSGKSTFLKQFQIHRASSLPKKHLIPSFLDERKEAHATILENLIIGLNQVMDQMTDWTPLFPESVSVIRNCGNPSGDGLEPLRDYLYLQAIENLWEDPAIRLACRLAGIFAANIPYFMNKFASLSDKDYAPTEQDILRSWTQTAGIYERTFDAGPFVYRVTDTGLYPTRLAGTNHERISGVVLTTCRDLPESDCIFYIVSISDYNIYKYNNKTTVHEAMSHLESILKLTWTMDLPVVLFLNGADLLEEKLNETPLSTYFPDYEGGPNLYSARNYFSSRFQDLDRRPTQKVHIYFTNATDTATFGATLESIEALIKPSLGVPNTPSKLPARQRRIFR